MFGQLMHTETLFLLIRHTSSQSPCMTREGMGFSYTTELWTQRLPFKQIQGLANGFHMLRRVIFRKTHPLKFHLIFFQLIRESLLRQSPNGEKSSVCLPKTQQKRPIV